MTKRILMLSGLCLAIAISSQAQTIINQPQSITVNNASSAMFTVGASGATTYQWRLNGTPLTDTGTNLAAAGSISGSTNATLFLENVTSNQAGTYTVLINNSVLSTNNAVLTVTNGTVVTFTLSGFLAGGSSNVQVQLFDHDKPITVQNFLHYLRAGGASNTIIERCVPGFVIQGGDYVISDRTNSSSPITGVDVATAFAANTNENPPFPAQIANEYYSGPQIRNDFGTLALPLSGNIFGQTLPDWGRNGFFFNIADNSSILDTTNNGPFTVFGRVINGTNTLQYFNGLTNGSGIVSNSVFLDNGTLQTNFSPFATLPVNYTGAALPANDNLVFCDITPTNLVADTNPPSVAITPPFVTFQPTGIQGTASDDTGVADVFGVLSPQAGQDGTYPYSETISTSIATGTTNWSLGLGGLYPGEYELSIQSQAGAGNLSSATNVFFTISGILVVGDGTVAFTGGADSSNNPIGYPLQITTYYTVVATPTNGATFVGWSGSDGSGTTNAINYFDYLGVVETATFISNTTNGITITSPAPGATLSNTLISIAGTINTGILTPPVTVTCQIFTNAPTNSAVTAPQSTTGTNNWLVGIPNYLPSGSYTVQALATDQNTNQTLVSESFNYIADTNPPTVVITSPAPNATFYEGDTINIQGLANDNGVDLLSNVAVVMFPSAEPDGVSPHGGVYLGYYATGTTNWSLDLTSAASYVPPGRYNVAAIVKDQAGNTNRVIQPITISAIRIDGDGTVALTQGTNSKPNPVGYPLQVGTQYQVQATAAAGQTFVDWTYGNDNTPQAAIQFSYNGSLATATFIPNSTPRGTKGISFIYPTSGQKLRTNSFLVKGRIAPSVRTAQVTCQIASLTTDQIIGSPLTTTGTGEWSVAVSNLPPDSYVIEVIGTNASGFSTFIDEAFSVLDFKGVAGTYSGLFLCTNSPVTGTNSGSFDLTVSPTGAYSAKMEFPSYKTIALGGAEFVFEADGASQFSLSQTYFPGNPMSVYFNLNVTNGTNTLTGYVFNANGSWISPLLCYRSAAKLSTHTIPATGKYVLDLLYGGHTNNPETNGYAAYAIAASGAVAVSGTLPDGAAFAESTHISTNGIWPLFAVPTGYKTNGIIMGWETNQPSGASSGQLYWLKNGGVGSYFTSGVNTNMTGSGTNFVSPSEPAAGDYSIVFQGGAISVPLTNVLTVARAGSQFRLKTPTENTNKLSISISPAGVLSGHFTSSSLNSGKPVQFKGAFFGPSQGGNGIILEGFGQIGIFVLQPQ